MQALESLAPCKTQTIRLNNNLATPITSQQMLQCKVKRARKNRRLLLPPLWKVVSQQLQVKRLKSTWVTPTRDQTVHLYQLVLAQSTGHLFTRRMTRPQSRKVSKTTTSRTRKGKTRTLSTWHSTSSKIKSERRDKDCKSWKSRQATVGSWCAPESLQSITTRSRSGRPTWLCDSASDSPLTSHIFKRNDPTHYS